MYFILFAVLINNAFGAAWGAVTLALGTVIQGTQVAPVFFRWFIGNVILTLLIVPLALRYGTPYIRKTKVFVRNYWD